MNDERNCKRCGPSQKRRMQKFHVSENTPARTLCHGGFKVFAYSLRSPRNRLKLNCFSSDAHTIAITKDRHVIATLMWFRRDLRLHDNTAFHHALQAAKEDGGSCAPFFCFDREILDLLQDKNDRRVEFIHQSLQEMDAALRELGSGLVVRYGKANEVLPALLAELAKKGLKAVYTNHDYEPQRVARDNAVRAAGVPLGVDFHSFKDHVVFEKNEVLTQGGTPQRVYTPYKKAWYKHLESEPTALRAMKTTELYSAQLTPSKSLPKSDPWAKLEDIGFAKTDLRIPGGTSQAKTQFAAFLKHIDHYGKNRDFPYIDGGSHLSVHLRFGTVSARELFTTALKRKTDGAQKWADELVWREFYNQILHHFPRSQNHAFQTQFENVAWDDEKKDSVAKKRFLAWCDGETGYPIVDAAMRELNTTGYMHNRCRMIVASFLTKDLHIHWKTGERYFAQKLLDYDMSQNLGGWQWAASTGADGQPYFRIFNPVSQGERWDSEGTYVRTYCPELAKLPNDLIHKPWEADLFAQQQGGCTIGKNYPARIVDHDIERVEALNRFRAVANIPEKPGKH